MGSTVYVRDTDRGFRAILAQVDALAKVRVEVGWHADKRHEGGKPTASIAAVHEFGSVSRSIPARPTLGPTVDRNASTYREYLQRLLSEAVSRGKDPEGALRIFGARVASDVKRSINELTAPPLSPATIARKGSSKPLIDTGAMRDQVDHRVVRGG